MGKKILVAESDSAVQQVISYFLNLEGFDVTTAADGIGALEAVEKSLPDAVLLSPGISGLNGIEVSRLIRERPQFKSIPILYIVDKEESLLKMGQDIPPGYGIINKPIDPTKMANTIKEHIGKVQQPPAEEGGGVSIEELLGWEVTEKPREEEAKPQEERSEINRIFSELFVTAESGQPPAPSEDIPSERGESVESKPDIDVAATGQMGAESLSEMGAVEPDLRARITDDMIKDIVSRIARDIIERTVSEVVPKIAEEEIQKEIKRLKGDSG